MTAPTTQLPEPSDGLALARPASQPALELAVPVYNEEAVLWHNIARLHEYLTEHINVPFMVTIADNASTDRTPEIARALTRALDHVRYLRLEEQGRGRALKTAWSATRAEVVGYMDVDLSTDLTHLPALLDPLFGARADIMIGSRLARGAVIRRGLKREFISRSYNLLLAAALGAGFTDAQCGFKAARRETIDALLPLIKNEGWFFDTELLYVAQRNAFVIHEVPVRWVDDPDSRVRIVRTVIDNVRGIARLRGQTRRGADKVAPPPARMRQSAATDSGPEASKSGSPARRLRRRREDSRHRVAA